MKKLNPFITLAAASIIGIMMFLVACYEFDYVYQPDYAEINSSFSVQISVSTTAGDSTGWYTVYFGIQLPIGWMVQDSIEFAHTNGIGYLVYSDSVSDLMTYHRFPEQGNYWWGSESTETVIYFEDDTYISEPIIITGNSPGYFYLDYMIGSSANGYAEEWQLWGLQEILLGGGLDSAVVTSAEDAGPGSLRESMIQLNVDGYISFDLGDNDTIFLDSVMVLTKNVTIEAPEDQPVVICGGNGQTIFNVNSNNSVIIANLVLLHQPGESGSAISCDGNSTTVLENISILNNQAGIYCNSAILDLDEVSIFNNYGHGIYCYSSELSLKNVSIHHNSTAIEGGGIYCRHSNLVFDPDDRCNIYANSGSMYHDIYSDQEMNVILDTFSVLHPTMYYAGKYDLLSFNVLNGYYEQVDADLYVSPDGDNSNSGLSEDDPFRHISYALSKICAYPGHPRTIHLLNGTYSESRLNEAFPIEMMGYAFIKGSFPDSVIFDGEHISNVFIFRDCPSGGLSGITIKNGLGQPKGGGIYIENSDPFLENIVVMYNSTGESEGGGIYCINSSPVIENSLITLNNGLFEGGGICCYESNLVVNNSIIRENTAKKGAGIYQYASNVQLDGVTLIGNSSIGSYGQSGGGMYCRNSEVDIINSLIHSNIVSFANAEGAGISCDNSRLTICHSNIEGNIALTDNSYHTYGGGICCDEATIAYLEDVMIRNNYASKGGGIYCEGYNGFVHLNYVDIVNNEAVSDGGGIFLSFFGPGEDTLQNVYLAGNQAATGGGIFIDRTDVMIRNALIEDNTAGIFGGGAFIMNSVCDLLNITVSSNNAMWGGGLCYSGPTESSLTNSILRNNQNDEVYMTENSSLTIGYSSVEDGQAGIYIDEYCILDWLEGNIDSDPLFEGSGPYPYQLSASSPCIDAGKPDTTGLNLPMWDLMGNYRLWDGNYDGDTIVDMGAYEFGSLGVKTPEFQVPGSRFQVGVLPNPFYEIVHIEYEIRNPSPVSIQVFNALGEKVADLSNGIVNTGQHQIIWNTTNLPAGFYFGSLIAGKEFVGFKLIKQ